MLFLFMAITAIKSYAQEFSFEVLYADLEKYTLAKQNDYIIAEVDYLVLSDNFTEEQKTIFQTFKVAALVESEMYDDALKLSNDLLASGKLPEKYKPRVWIQQSLVFEIVMRFEESLKKLNLVETFYMSHEKDRYYGVFLYRKSSLYRVSGRESLGLPLAIEAKAFGLKYDYKDVIGTADFLIESMSKSTGYEQSLKHLEESVKNHLAMGDYESAGYLYSGIARLNIQFGYDEEAKCNLHKALAVEKYHAQDSVSAQIAYENLAIVHNRLGRLDSALFYTNKANEYNMLKMLNDQQLKVDKLEGEREAMRRRFDVERVTNDFKQSEKARKRLLISLGLLIIVLAVIAFLLVKNYKRNAQIQQQKNDIQEKNTALNLSLASKNTLLKELNHRVKNNLALIMSLTNFHSQDVVNPKDSLKFQDLESRIRAISMVHEQFIYKDDVDLNSKIILEKYVEKMIDSLLSLSNRSITYRLIMNDIQINMDTMLPIGILINELVNNTIKHANGPTDNLQVKIDAKNVDDKLLLRYADNGASFTLPEENTSLGLFIIESMVQQLNGTYTRSDSEYSFRLNLK